MIVVNNLLILQVLHIALFLLLSPYTNIVVSGGARENAPFFKFAQCTSRTLRTNDGGTTYYIVNDIDTNSTDDDNGIDHKSMANNIAPTSSSPYCPEGFYCDLVQKTDSILGLCRPCSGSSEQTCFDGRFNLTSSTIEDTFEMASVEECQEQCGTENNLCSSSEDCPNTLFCNLESDGAGFCHACPPHPFKCKDITVGDKNLTSQGFDSCVLNCDLQCRVAGSLTTTDSSTDISFDIADVNGIYNTIQVLATGPIVDCGLGLETCLDVEGAVCFIERGKAPFINKTRNCEAGGGVAVVIYNVQGDTDCKNIDGTFNELEAFIPAVTLTHLDGKKILEEAKAIYLESPDSPMYATVDVGGPGIYPGRCVAGCMEGHECGANGTCDYENGEYGDCEVQEGRQFCNDGASIMASFLPCLKDNEFCDFSLGKRGYCDQCPETPVECFYSGLDGLGTKECSNQCGNDYDKTDTELENFKCKVCPVLNFTLDDVTEGFSSTKVEIENPCSFCAEKNETERTPCSDRDRWDMEYPERTIRLFGSGIECWAVAEFYRSLNIDADSPYCESARTFNYVCGCSDSVGYAGANTKSKQSALVWMPRIGAILSILGSIGMIISVLNDKEKKKKVIGELIIALSCFDIIGSLGYAFSSLPIPEEDYILGAKGNPASCKAQGFFIQLGTTSLYINVSMAFYYLLIIQFSWRERRLRKSPIYYLLYVIPITVGAIFAFAAIPYYENAVMWCNNSQKYWSEVPVGVAILIATYLMLSLCWFVYKSERASARFSARASTTNRASLSKQFFNQSMVYLAAFYLTWPAYLALQIMLANGNAFSSYGFYLFAGTAVTLQGFWNFVFHSGLQFKTVKKRVSSAISNARTSIKKKGSSRILLNEESTNDLPRRASTRSQRRSSNNRRSSGEFSGVTSKNLSEG